jgi:hypothetical protein
MHTKSHADWFGHSNNIKVIASIMYAAAVLVLLMWVLYEVHSWDGLKRQDVCTKFHDDWFRHSSNIRLLPQKFERLQHWYYWWEGFMSIQLILRFCFSNLRGCNVGIIDVRDWWSTPLRRAQATWYEYQNFMKIGSGNHNVLRGWGYTHREQVDLISLFLFFKQGK